MNGRRSTRYWPLLTLAACSASDSQFVATSYMDGAQFYLVVTETKREPAKSVISVPGFHARTAPGARWLMCMYNELAAQRGFKYWTVIYPEEPTETFPIALYQTPNEDVRRILGNEYSAERAFPPAPVSVERWYQTICAWKRK